MTRDDLKSLGEVLDEGAAGLVVVYGVDMSDRVSASLDRARRKVRATTSLTTEQLEAALRDATPSA
jgi:uncharacterized membrane protein